MKINAQMIVIDTNEFTVVGSVYGIDVVVTASTPESAVEGFNEEIQYFASLFEEEVAQWTPFQVAA